MSRNLKDKPGGHRQRTYGGANLKQAARENRRAAEHRKVKAMRDGAVDPDAATLPTTNAEVANPWDWD